MTLPPVGDLAEWAVVVVSILNACGTVAMLKMRAEFASKGALEKLDRRVVGVERDLDGLPEAKEVEELRREFLEMKGDHKGLAAEMGGIRDQIDAIRMSTDRIETYLLNAPRGGK